MSRSNFKSNQYWLLNVNTPLFEMRFDPIKAFVKSMNRMIEIENEELKKKYNAVEQERPKHDIDYPDAFDIYESEIMNQREYPKLLYNSMFLTVYSYLENEFRYICSICRTIEGHTLDAKDLSGSNYLQQSRDYIAKVVGVQLNDVNDEWRLLKIYQTLRNIVAHRQGKVDSSEKKAREFINKNKGVSIDSNTSELLINSDQFLNDFIQLSISFLTKVSKIIFDQKSASGGSGK